MSLPKITVGIVLYQGETYLPDCLKSLFSQDYDGEIEFLFCDHSPEGEAGKYIQKHFPKESYQLFFRQGNHSQGHNFLMRKMTGDHYCCGSYDMVYEKDCLQQLVRSLEGHPEAVVVGPKLLQWKQELPPFQGGIGGCEQKPEYQKIPPTPFQKGGEKRIDSTGIIQKSCFAFVDRGQGEEDTGQYDEQQVVFGLSGAAILFREPMPFDENLHYKNDIDLAFRVQQMQKKCLFVPEAVVYHDRQVGKAVQKTKQQREDSLFGHLVVIKKHYNALSFSQKIRAQCSFFFRFSYGSLFLPKAIEKYRAWKRSLLV